MKEIKRERSGFIAESCIDDMRNSMPIAIIDDRGSRIIIKDDGELEDYLFCRESFLGMPLTYEQIK